jgi:hypothetical protein
MRLWGSAVLLAGIMPGFALAGARIDLVPRGGLEFSPGSAVTIDFFLTQDPGGRTRGLRFIQLDFTSTATTITLGPRFHFTRLPGFDWPPGDRDIYPAPNVVWDAYLGTNYPNRSHDDPYLEDWDQELMPWYYFMHVLEVEEPMRIGLLNVTLPSAPGRYLIDAMHGESDSLELGAVVVFGFGLAPNNKDPITVWRARTGELTVGAGYFQTNARGLFEFHPIPEPATAALLLAGGAMFLHRRLISRKMPIQLDLRSHSR